LRKSLRIKTRLRNSACLALLLTAPAIAAETTAWNYGAGANNDEGWGELSPEFASCEIGTSQSPIAITFTKIADLPPLKFDYTDTQANIAMRDHTLTVNLENPGTLTIGKDNYHLTQIRFHSPSEHPIRDEDYPLEIHLIHRNEKGQILIVAIMAQFGEENPALSAILAHMKDPTASSTLNPKSLLPQTPGYFSYTGSLTWPPCTEGVEWRILKTPITMSLEQFQPLVKYLQRNARLPQPVYMRTVLESKD